MTKQTDHRLQAAAGAAALAAGAAAVGKAIHDRGARRDEAQRRRFRLGDGEPVGEGVRRIARGQLDDALELLAGPLALHDGASAGGAGKAIHDIRKDLKRLRALVRLARDEVGREVQQAENAVFRDAGLRLSGVRDAKVLVDTLDDIVGRHADELPVHPFAGLRAELVSELRAAQERVAHDTAALGEVATALEAARTRVAAWPLADDGGPERLAGGFERTFRRGRRALKAARKDLATETLHDLRKRTKDLWHAAQVLRPVAPKRMKRIARRAHRLADVIGADHDLAVLRAAARARRHALLPADLALLEALIDRRRARLQRRALKLAKRLYAPRPRKVAAVVRAG